MKSYTLRSDTVTHTELQFHLMNFIQYFRYRQATIGAMGALSKVNGRKALTLAYGDVKRAFYHFLDR